MLTFLPEVYGNNHVSCDWYYNNDDYVDSGDVVSAYR